MPADAVNTIQAISFQLAAAKFFMLPFKSSATPAGSRTKMNGTKMAGATYFQLWNVVLYGSPLQMAAAANGDKAVGGDTSDNTA